MSTAAAQPLALSYAQLVPARLLRRYKRFLGDVVLGSTAEGDQPVTIHVPNTGPMTGLLDGLPARALLSVAPDGSKRKYPHTLEFLQSQEGVWVGTHSAKANTMVRQLLDQRLLPQLLPYGCVQSEVKFGEGGKSRVDFVLHEGSQPAAAAVQRSAKRRRAKTSSSAAGPASANSPAAVEAAAALAAAAAAPEAVTAALAAAAPAATCLVEVKSVTLAEDLAGGGGRIALFPDTVSERAQRHVRELMAVARAGGRAALVFLVQRGDCCVFAPCHEKDPAYGSLVRDAAAAGVLLIPAVCALDADAACVRFGGTLPIDLDYKWQSDADS